MSTERLPGVDVSQWQGYVNWGAVHSSGVQFAAVKATEGVNFGDPTFPHNWVSLAYRGMRRVAYHFLHMNSSGYDQANFFHNYVRLHGGFHQGDGILLDFEVTDGYDAQHCIRVAHDFIERARYSISKQVILYTYPYFWDTLMGAPDARTLATCPLWIASYGPTYPQLANWPVTSFWQYTAEGSCPGIAGAVDLDYFLGSSDQLHRVLQYPPK